MFYKEEIFLKNMINLIKECNNIVIKIYEDDFKISSKKDESPLTKADTECNKHICKFINKLYINNETILISEENKNSDYIHRKNKKYAWLIDPLDGTKEFIKKNGQFTINIGLCKNNVPVFGIVSIPCTGEIFYGIEGVGSFKLINQNLTKLEVNQFKDFNKPKLKIIASSSHLNNETKKFISNFNDPIKINIGSSIKLLLIAENKADIYPRIAPTSEWDTCAAHAVVKYAGGKVLVYNSENEIKYNKENLLNPNFIVY